MIGASAELLGQLDAERALGRIRSDVRTDFILAPHYSAVFAHAGKELWDRVQYELRSGTFEPALPITMEVPKASRLTRPGSILTPADRLVYQAVVDHIAPMAEAQLDRRRVYSYVLLQDDPTSRMFEENHKCWAAMQDALLETAASGLWKRAVRTDVAAFFERLYQHNLINLLVGSGCDPGAVNSLEKLLLAWMQKESHGIIQGVFPSDFLGNFYLCALDADLELRGIPSIRYVDDIYVFTEDYRGALRALVYLSAQLRREGLNLNESKTKILPVDKLIEEETEIDRRFAEARQEVVAQAMEAFAPWYGFQSMWEIEEAEREVEAKVNVQLGATKALYESRTNAHMAQREKIERFCLPVFAAAQDPAAVDDVLEGFQVRPHLSQVYASYLAGLMQGDDQLAARVAATAGADLAYDWQAMWHFGALLSAQTVPDHIAGESLKLLRDTVRSPGLRAVCALISAKFGTTSQRRILRLHYADEPSEYVRSAIVFASRYLPTAERNTCLSSWAGHSPINSLIARSVKILAHES